MTTKNALSDAINRIRSFIPEDELAKADRVAEMNGRYIGRDHDTTLDAAVKGSLTSIAVTDPDQIRKPDKRRIIVLTGESGAGKTTALFEHTRNCAAMQPYIDAENREIYPVLAYNAPSPCTPLRLALTGLDALDYPMKGTISEHAAWSTFARVLIANKVQWVIIDEAQHAVETANRLEIKKIASNFKNLVQMPEWPIRLILSGVEPLAAFAANKQIANRKTVVSFEKVKGSQGDRAIAALLQMIIEEHAGLATSLHEELQFVHRLAHACDRDFGTIVQTIRSAVELAIERDDRQVVIEHFVAVYVSMSGCLPYENVFTAKIYEDFSPYRAALRDADFKWEEATWVRRKSTKRVTG